MKTSRTWLVLLTVLSFLLGPGPSLSQQRPRGEESEEGQSFSSSPVAQISEASQKLTASTPNISPVFSTTPLPMLAGLLVIVVGLALSPRKQHKLFLQYGKLQLDGA